jgi:hypothetical protein
LSRYIEKAQNDSRIVFLADNSSRGLVIADLTRRIKGKFPDNWLLVHYDSLDESQLGVGPFVGVWVDRPALVGELSIVGQKFSDINSLVSGRGLVLPDNHTECAAVHLRLLETLADHDPNKTIPHFNFIFGKGSNRYQDMYEDFFEQVLVPFCSFIDERIDDGDLLLYMLCRYQRECVWFEAKALADLAQTTDSRKLEDVLDKHLRSWLFREGIDYPFSKPSGPSGEADVVVWQGEEPLPLEVKVFDGGDRDLGHVSQGLWQAHRYAQDYNKPFGYLMTFNTSGHLLAFENNVATSGPPCVVVSGMNVFAVTVNLIAGRPSASKEKPIETKTVKTPA